jgi:two-component system nitrogen regulation response regulator NtrX
MVSILLIDDEPNILRSLGTFLRQLGYRVYTAPDSAGARSEALKARPEVIVLDLCLGADDGFRLLTELRQTLPKSHVIMISGRADIAQAVRAIHAGAWDFMEKPIDPDRLDIVIRNALREDHLQGEVLALRDRWKAQNLCAGCSPLFAECLATIERTAGRGLTILLQGANGTGKEVLARYAHLCGDRADRPLVIVNCATISRDLAESQLFGHSKGAFTGAVAESAGFFGQADGGTLFLDEIGELSLEVQSKLLRAIEYGEIQALGSSATVKVSVSLIVASNRDLAGLVGQRSFRQDLFYRINQVPVAIPGLEQRREDIPALIDFWARSLGADPPLLGEEAIEYLCARSWPGNVRELKNLLQRLIVLCEHRPIGLDELLLLDNARGSDSAQAIVGDERFWREPMPLGMARRRLEKRYLETQLAVHGWSVKDTAAALNILPGNLSRRLGELDIKNRI